MSLTRAQLAERQKGLGASDAPRIMAGDWFALWQEKTSRAEPEDLSGVWAVQLGSFTEPLNLDWIEKKLGPITMRGEAVVCRDHPFMRCTLDGVAGSLLKPGEGGLWCGPDTMIVEAKHTNCRATIEDMRERYTPQVTHQMVVTGARKAALSVIIGSNEPVLEMVEYDEFYAAQYIDRAREFWRHVQEDVAPAQGRPEVAPPAPAALRKVSFEGNNRWAMHAADWITHQQGAKLFKAAEVGIKALVEADVAEASGHGIRAVRDRRGVSIKSL